jgi:hypothetical protein
LQDNDGTSLPFAASLLPILIRELAKFKDGIEFAPESFSYLKSIGFDSEPEKHLADTIDFTNTHMRGPSQKLDFFARRLFVYRNGASTGIQQAVLASPLYVALSDTPELS